MLKGYTTGFMMSDQIALGTMSSRANVCLSRQDIRRSMILGDKLDADLMHTFEENNERFDGARDAGALRYLMVRRAFAGCPDVLAEASARRAV